MLNASQQFEDYKAFMDNSCNHMDAILRGLRQDWPTQGSQVSLKSKPTI